MGDTGLANLRWAFALVDGLAAGGVVRVIISPGSRSTPLVLACRRHPGIRSRVILDERDAAFQALGQGKITTLPSAVIATLLKVQDPLMYCCSMARNAAARGPVVSGAGNQNMLESTATIVSATPHLLFLYAK